MLRSRGPVRIIMMKTSHLTMIPSNHLNEWPPYTALRKFLMRLITMIQKTVSPGRFFFQTSLKYPDILRSRSPGQNHHHENLTFDHDYKQAPEWINLQAQLFGNFSLDWLRCLKKLFLRVDSFSRHLWSILTCSEVGVRSDSWSWKPLIWQWWEPTTEMNQPPSTALQKFLLILIPMFQKTVSPARFFLQTYLK